MLMIHRVKGKKKTVCIIVPKGSLDYGNGLSKQQAMKKWIDQFFMAVPVGTRIITKNINRFEFEFQD